MKILKKNTKQVNPKTSGEPAFYSLKELSLLSFIACNIKNELELIIKSGKANKEQLEDAWMSLLSDYYEVRKDESNLDYLNLQKEIWALKIRIEHLDILINHVRAFNDEAIPMLQSYGYEHLTFQADTINEDIQQVINSEARTVHDLLMYEAELQTLYADRTEKIKDEDFWITIDRYNEVFKRDVRVEDITAFDYARHCNRLDGHYKELERRNREIGE